MDANADGSRARRCGEPREHVAQYAAKCSKELADDGLAGWDAEDRARLVTRSRQDESAT